MEHFQVNPMGELAQQVHRIIADENHQWINTLMQRHSGVTVETRVKGKNQGHVYIFEDAVLNKPLIQIVEYKTNGEKCGDNGGRTQKGTPCRLNGIKNGRCSRHQVVLEKVVYSVGDCLPRLIVDWGNDHNHRPLGKPISWKQCLINGMYSPINIEKESVSHTSASSAWNHVILGVKEYLKLPLLGQYDAHGTMYPTDPLWTTDRFMKTYNVHGLEDGYFMEDFGVVESALSDGYKESRMRKIEPTNG